MKQLAIDGGPRAVSQPLPPMYPGGMRIGEEEEQAVLEVLRAKRLFRYYGPNPGESKAAQLEAAFAAHMGSPFAVAVTSGTAALICGLAALGVGPGDEVIVPAYTWIASASAALAVGAVPVIAECDETLTLDPADVEAKLTSATRAIVAVHMRGAPCDMDRLMGVARRHGVRVLEDVAQACGGSYGGRRLGTIGDVGAFSLQFNKIITSGEGGVVLTGDPGLHRRVQMYQDVVGGQRNGVPPEEILPGLNYRMAELPAAVALVQLGRLEGLLAAMRAHKATLKASVGGLFEQKGLRFRALSDPAGDTAIALVFFAHDAEQAAWISRALQAEGVGAGTLYKPESDDYHIYPHWHPIMNKRTWSEQGGPWRWHAGPLEYTPDMCPRTLDLLGRAVHLNISPDLSGAQVEEVAEALNKVVAALG